MSRLIDADNLNFEGQNYNKSQMKAILDFIDKQPTAYDIEKVVAEIKELRVDDNYECIDIVRKGGV